ncbi:DNA polymerase IV [Aliidiomarina sedimenti]|uniref:DNA polymerase IV n=1 Tax=Aliidiomarina sedimenti TaxID=1933879 RepID=A0ABY0C0R5_9GAMM|nr:DNA polymerase IV [Aliidiomarina sedimenti]RUO30768.1 DNA polymerase IV [Aliidiomarina sedimenti]
MDPHDRKIALLDLDAFFAAVEVKKDPALASVPFAVGGGGERGVVATANYLARQFGVRSAMPGHQARRLCPQLHFVRPDMAAYKDTSMQIQQRLLEVTPHMEPASIDEFYLDLTENQLCKGSASMTMEMIRDELRDFGVTGSAGISNQKMVAKIASEEHKPDGQTLITPDQVFSYIGQLALARIPGIGPKSQQRLHTMGWHYGADIQALQLDQLQKVLGDKAGYVLHQRCLGIDLREVVTTRVRKSVGTEETLRQDLTSLRAVEQFTERELLPSLKRRLRIDRWQDARIKTQTVKLKFNDFQQTTVSRASNRISPSIFYSLLREAWDRRALRSVRLIGISVTLPDPDSSRQLELDLE